MDFNKINYNTQGELTMNDDNVEPSSDKWEMQKGKKVILIEPDNPWWLNKINTAGQKINDQSKFVMDLDRPDMGYGYSYAARLGKPCTMKDNKLFETFEPESNSLDFNSIASVLLLVLIFIIIIRSCVKNRV